MEKKKKVKKNNSAKKKEEVRRRRKERRCKAAELTHPLLRKGEGNDVRLIECTY